MWLARTRAGNVRDSGLAGETRICERCNQQNIFVTSSQSVRCSNCRAYIDWRLHLVCRRCGEQTRCSRMEVDQLRCGNCIWPLSHDDALENYKPNAIPRRKRITHSATALFLLGVSGYTVITQHVILPIGGRGRGELVEFSGTGITLPLISFGLALVATLAPLLDHYDKRPNEHLYAKVETKVLVWAYLFYFASFIFGRGYIWS